MKNKGFYRLLMVAAMVVITACAPMQMGLHKSSLDQLLKEQDKCDELRKSNFKGVDKDQQNALIITCENNKSALEMAAQEYAAEAAKVGTLSANKVFWYRLAATAGWRSQRESAMADAITYADEGTQICRKNDGIQPADCAIMHVIHAFVANDTVALMYADLENKAKTAEGATSPGKIKQAQQREFLKLEKDGMTKIENMTTILLRSGWQGAENEWGEICNIQGYHKDIIDALTVQEQDIVGNLKKLHTRAVNLPLVPQNRTWLGIGLCKNGGIDTSKTAELYIAPAGTDFIELNKLENPRSPEAAEAYEKHKKNNQSLMNRAMLHTYCAWQHAEKNTKTLLERCQDAK